MKISRNTSILAADEDPFADMDDFDDAPIEDEDIEDNEEVIEEDYIDEVDPDTPNLPTDNNIAGHFIAECELCHGIFITSLMEGEEQVHSISGECPLCHEDGEQYIKWVIKDVDFDIDVDIDSW